MLPGFYFPCLLFLFSSFLLTTLLFTSYSFFASGPLFPLYSFFFSYNFFFFSYSYPSFFFTYNLYFSTYNYVFFFYLPRSSTHLQVILLFLSFLNLLCLLPGVYFCSTCIISSKTFLLFSKYFALLSWVGPLIGRNYILDNKFFKQKQ